MSTAVGQHQRELPVVLVRLYLHTLLD